MFRDISRRNPSSAFVPNPEQNIPAFFPHTRVSQILSISIKKLELDQPLPSFKIFFQCSQIPNDPKSRPLIFPRILFINLPRSGAGIIRISCFFCFLTFPAGRGSGNVSAFPHSHNSGGGNFLSQRIFALSPPVFLGPVSLKKSLEFCSLGSWHGWDGIVPFPPLPRAGFFLIPKENHGIVEVGKALRDHH